MIIASNIIIINIITQIVILRGDNEEARDGEFSNIKLQK